MKTRTITFNVYQFSELPEKAKEAAKQRYAELFGYAWADEALASLKALASHFGAELKNYSIDFFNSSYSDASFNVPDDVEPEDIAAQLARLGTYDPQTLRGHGDCVLTGFCMDESAIDGFRRAWHNKETDLGKLLQSAFRSWLQDAQADCEGQYTDEQFAEHCEANGYEFDERGKAV
jgi:hypothetical protein